MGPCNAPSRSNVVGDATKVESSNAPAPHPVFEFKRNKKNGEARHLELREVSRLFGRLLPDAAKELGMSKSSLKKACRFFGLPRWPGRKVRGLESAIDRVQQAVVGQGAHTDLDLRSEIPKLQQELDELYHGTPEQIQEKMESSGSQISKSAYKRLYYAHDWRSEHHNSQGVTTSRPSTGTDAVHVPRHEVPESAVQAQQSKNMLTPKTENIGEEGPRDVEVEGVDEGATASERSDKRLQKCVKCGSTIMP